MENDWRTALTTGVGQQRLAFLAKVPVETVKPRSKDRTAGAPPTEPQRSKELRLAGDKARHRISRFAHAILMQVFDATRTSPLKPGDLAPFKKWAFGVLATLAPAAGQGIVVAGQYAGDVRVLNNTISGFMDGIHVGLSHHDPKSDNSPDVAYRVQIVGNTVSVRMPADQRGGHAGIFVGNASNVSIERNQIDIDGGQTNKRATGIKVWGTLGPMLLVSSNATTHTDTGIQVFPVNGGQLKQALWLVTQNVASDSNLPIDAPTEVLRSQNVP
jgi:hypothetical protein